MRFRKAFAVFTASVALSVSAQNRTTPGELRSYSTLHSIGVEWDIQGDANHNATCKARYRAQGADEWKEALPLFRVDYFGWYADTKADRAYNMLAGSVLFLKPGATYEVRLELSDPDGGGRTETLTMATRAEPRMPKDGRQLHVVPGAGGGDGLEQNPFQGLAAAQAVAKAGDVFLLHRGDYGRFTFDKPGDPNRYVVWKSAGDGEAVFGAIEVGASHVWLEGLTLRTDKGGNGLRGRDVENVVVRRCHFTGFHYSICLGRGSRAWYIADNVIVGDNHPVTGGIGGEGIELSHSSDHDVCFNRISRTADGVSYCHRNCDIYNNDIFDVSDDGLEPDYGYANNRMWCNRLTNCHHADLSFQPMYCGPWYFIRNQCVGRGHAFKFRVQDRFLLAHNTFVRWGYMDSRMHHILTSLSRNNLYIAVGGKLPVWFANPLSPKSTDVKYVLPDRFAANWMTDVDYDGFDWGESSDAFRWDRKNYKDIETFWQAVGIERRGVRVRAREIFEKWIVPVDFARVEPHNLTLRAGCNATDAGARLPNINDDFEGKAPDLGPHESGRPAPHYGPR